MESLSPPEPLEVTDESLEEGDGSGFPICEQVCAKRARGLFFASSCRNQKGTHKDRGLVGGSTEGKKHNQKSKAPERT